MVTYEKIDNNTIKVFLGEFLKKKKHVGNIKKVVGWQYFPKGSKIGGEVFANLLDCKNSIEEE